MPDQILQGPVGDKLREIINRNKSQAPADPVTSEPAAQAASTEPAEPIQPAATEPAQPTAPEPATAPTEPVTTEEPVEPVSWDAEPTTTVQDPKPVLDFTKIGSALNLGEIKDEQDLITKVGEQLKQARKTIQDDELRTLVELAEQGVDWRSLITADYSKEDPVKIFERELAQDPRFKNADGSFNEALFLEELDTIPETLRRYQGNQILGALNQRQAQLRQTLQYQAEQRRERFDNQLREVSLNLNRILPFEQYGIKFEPKHSEHLYRGISDGSLLKKHFLNEQGQYDAAKTLRTIAAAEYVDKMVQYRAGKAAVDTKRDILNRTQNPVTQTPATPAPPAEPEQPKVLSAPEKVKAWQERIMQQGRL